MIEDRWIQTKNLAQLLDWEPFTLIALLALSSWLFYRFFLKGVSAERHESLRMQLWQLLQSFIFLTVLFLLYHLARLEFLPPRLAGYLGLLTFFWGVMVFVRTTRLLLLQYLFLSSMRVGVPLLIVNIYSLASSIALLLWGISVAFNVQVGPLLATSAAFSLILGLAMQDTLGNLFAGMSLQLDRAFEIDDWLEITHGSQKVVGQVREITWRATTLIGWSDEVIVLPNRIVASSQIANYSGGLSFVRNQVFRLPYSVNAEQVRAALTESVKANPDVLASPPPLCFISEANDSWLAFKLCYSINRFGAQFIIGDQVLREGWQALAKLGYKASAPSRLAIETQHSRLALESQS